MQVSFTLKAPRDWHKAGVISFLVGLPTSYDRNERLCPTQRWVKERHIGTAWINLLPSLLVYLLSVLETLVHMPLWAGWLGPKELGWCRDPDGSYIIGGECNTGLHVGTVWINPNIQGIPSFSSWSTGSHATKVSWPRALRGTLATNISCVLWHPC